MEAMGDKGVFARIIVGLAAKHREEKTVMIDAPPFFTPMLIWPESYDET